MQHPAQTYRREPSLPGIHLVTRRHVDLCRTSAAMCRRDLTQG